MIRIVEPGYVFLSDHWCTDVDHNARILPFGNASPCRAGTDEVIYGLEEANAGRHVDRVNDIRLAENSPL